MENINEKNDILNSSLTYIIRLVGVILIVVASMTFMFQNWEGMNYILRFFSSLGFSTLLIGMGLFLGVKVKESTGAKTFIYLSLFSVPVLFSQMGAMLYGYISSKSLDISLLPSLLDWKSAEMTFAILLLLIPIGLITSGAISYAGLKGLYKDQFSSLLLIFMALNSLILLPFRSDIATAIILMLASAIYLFARYDFFPLIQKISKHSTFLLNALFGLPGIIILFRGMMLHDPGFFTLHYFILLIGVSIFYLSFKNSNDNSVKHFGAFLICYVVYAVAERFLPISINGFGLKINTIAFWFVIPSIIFLSKFVGKDKNAYTDLAFLTFIVTIFERIFYSSNFSYIIFCVLGSFISILIAYQLKKRGYLFIGFAALGLTLVKYIGLNLFNLASENPWLTLASIGILAILSASMIEKYKLDLRQIWLKFKE